MGGLESSRDSNIQIHLDREEEERFEKIDDFVGTYEENVKHLDKISDENIAGSIEKEEENFEEIAQLSKIDAISNVEQEKMYPCNKCEYMTVKFANLKRHKFVKHE